MADVVDDGSVQYMLSTVDNPFNPWTSFDEWRTWDEASGYHTMGFLARIVIDSPDLSLADEAAATQVAIQEIVTENVNGVYVRIPKSV